MTQHPLEKRAGNTSLAIRYRLLAVLCSAVMAALMRATGQHIPIGELIFTRSVISILLLTLFVGARGQLAAALYTAQPFGHFARGLLGVVSMFAYIAALVRLPLLDVTVFVYSTPIITVVLGALILKEFVRLYRWSAVVVGFIGVLVMIWPYLTLFEAGGSTAALRCALRDPFSPDIRRIRNSSSPPHCNADDRSHCLLLLCLLRHHFWNDATFRMVTADD